ncbi:MAG: single-stranded DNA-binding protein [Prevotellaceae bacterium]|jgi:single-strand DNA-binding protein|nr:single-stranded DNA-binding protein [Prevotellaceae bacterium]
MSYNKVILIGNVGRDPEIRYLDNGAPLVTLSVATTERIKDHNGAIRENTEWHNVVFWRNLAETVDKYVKKGSQIFIEGKLRTRMYEDKTGKKNYVTEIVAENVRLLGVRKEYDGAQHQK